MTPNVSWKGGGVLVGLGGGGVNSINKSIQMCIITIFAISSYFLHACITPPPPPPHPERRTLSSCLQRLVPSLSLNFSTFHKHMVFFDIDIVVYGYIIFKFTTFSDLLVLPSWRPRDPDIDILLQFARPPLRRDLGGVVHGREKFQRRHICIRYLIFSQLFIENNDQFKHRHWGNLIRVSGCYAPFVC